MEHATSFRIKPKLVIFFLSGFGFLISWSFPKTCYADVAFPTKKQTPTPQYVVEMQTEYPADQTKPKKISAIFVKGSKNLWTHIEPYPMVNAVVIQDTGMSFLKLGEGPIVELRVYTKTGAMILDKKNVVPLTVSFEGNFIAFETPAIRTSRPVLTMVYDLKHKTTKKYNTGIGCRGVALSGDGKDLLFWDKGTGPYGSTYSLVNEKGDKVWERNGPVRFLALGNKGKWLLWTNQEKKTIECSDFKTGKIVREISATIFKMLYKQLPEIRSF